MIYMDMPGVIRLICTITSGREVNLGSYKLNDVTSHFIGDMVKDGKN